MKNNILRLLLGAGLLAVLPLVLPIVFFGWCCYCAIDIGETLAAKALETLGGRS